MKDTDEGRLSQVGSQVWSRGRERLGQSRARLPAGSLPLCTPAPHRACRGQHPRVGRARPQPPGRRRVTSSKGLGCAAGGHGRGSHAVWIFMAPAAP